MRTFKESSRRCVLWALAVAVGVLVIGARPAACGPPPQPSTEYAPGVTPGAAISLLDAITLALQHDPTIRKAQQASRQQKGSVQQSLGLFDLAGIVQPSAQTSSAFLYAGQRKGQEQLRDLRRQAANELQRIADDLDQQIHQANPAILPPTCQGTIVYTQDPVTGETYAQCIPASLAAEKQLWFHLMQNFQNSELAQTLQDVMLQQAVQERDQFSAIAKSLRISLRNLGTVPESGTVTTFTLNLGLSQPFRNGIVLTPAVLVTSVNDNFDGKPPNQNYGGKGVADRTTSTIGFEVAVPLGQGGGTVSADAPERSAKFQLQASLENEAFAVSSSVLSTELAYWRLVAAQETLALLQRSLKTEEELLELGHALVKGDQIAPSDLAYLQARIASTRGSVAQGRQSVLQARIDLAVAMGLAVQKADDAPGASDRFPAVPAHGAIDELRLPDLSDAALANRSDLASARRLLDSANVVAAAARSDLRPRIDLTFAAAYQGLHQGGHVTHWGDYWTTAWDALSDFGAGPSALIGIDFSWPFKNNVAQGRYAQARSLAFQSEIRADDLTRVIGSNTTTLLGSLRRAARQIEEAQAAADFYQQSLDAQVERFKLGESTAIDLLLTEDDQLSQFLSLVSARQSFVQLLTQLRFETGTLVTYRIEADAVRLEDLQPVGLEFPKRSAK